jgi:hypothetical protein
MIETLLATLAVGTIWFWLILVLASVIIIACVEHEHYPTPSVVAILLGAIYWKALVAAPWQVIALVVGVFALAGALWSAFQWFRRVNTKARYYREKYGSVLSESAMSQLKEETLASRHKALITGWIAFWPWDCFWTLTGDFFYMIYDAMANVYQKISDVAIGKFTVAPPKAAPKTEEDADGVPYNAARGRRQY